MQGRYEKKKAKKPVGWKKVLLISVISVLLLIVAVGVGVAIYYNSMLDKINIVQKPTINYTQADILLDEDASRAVDIVGEGDYEGTAAPVSVYIDLSAFGKGFFSDNKNANRDFYASHEEKQAPLYVYRMKVNPKGNFAKSIKGLHPVSEHAARQML